MAWKRAHIAVALVPALLALALRLHGLSDKPLWLDEIITQKRALLPFPELLSNSLANTHFPTYFLLVRAFDARIIDEMMLRLPSVIFGCVAVLLATLIATEVRSLRAGLMAGTLMALSPLEVQFSQEARSYALISCLILLALWGLVRIAKQSAIDMSPLGRPRGTRAAWVAYTIGTIAALNVLLVSAFWLLASNIAMAFVIARSQAKRAALIRNWVVAQAVIVLVWLPGLAAIALASHHDPLRGYRWIPPSTLHHVGLVLSTVYLFRASDITTFELLPTPVPWLGAAVLALALFGAWRLKDESKLRNVIGLAAITMPAAMLVMSTVHAIWIPRYLLWSTGPYFVLAGIGAAELPRRLFPLAAMALAIAGIVNLAPYYRHETKPRWDLAAAYLATHAQPGAPIVASSYAARYVLAAYGDRYHLDRPILDGADVALTAGQLEPSGSVWVVYGRTGQAVIPPPQTYLEKWSALGTPAATIHFGRHVIAWRFDRRSTAATNPND
jgi:mannosyltransferase